MTPKNWQSFQHYKDRSPPWIKLHHSLLDDYRFHCLPVASKALAPLIWLLASEYSDGNITASVEEIAFRFRMPLDKFMNALKPLIEQGFMIDDSDMLAECKQRAMPETETETEAEIEAEAENEPRMRARDAFREAFDRFWSAWPNKVGKPAALKAFSAAIQKATLDRILAGVQSYIQYKPADRQWLNPATFLNQERWNDVPASNGVDKHDRSVVAIADRWAAEFEAKAGGCGAGDQADILGLPSRRLSES